MDKGIKIGYASETDGSNPEYIQDANRERGICSQWIPPRQDQQVIDMNNRVSYVVRTILNECSGYKNID